MKVYIVKLANGLKVHAVDAAALLDAISRQSTPVVVLPPKEMSEELYLQLPGFSEASARLNSNKPISR